jgi:probable HAF family extracellular repeat protein
MKSRETPLVTLALVLFIFNTSAFAYRPIIYLGKGWVGGINDNGQCVGYSSYPRNIYWQATLFDSTGNGNNLSLGSLGNRVSYALSINNSGQIVGQAGAGEVSPYGSACLFDQTGHGANINLGITGEQYSYAESINNNGQIVGYSVYNSGNNNKRAYIFKSASSRTFLGNGAAYCNNDKGQIGGYSYFSGNYHACLFDPTGNLANLDLGTLDGYTSSVIYSINESGQIVGSSFSSDGRAILFDPTGNKNNINLGTLGGNASEAISINDLGQIVGSAYTKSGNLHACIFDPTGHGNNIDLNTLIDPSLNITLTYANGINNNGWIIATGNNNAYLITPEPATILLFVIGGFALRKRK